MKNLKKVFAAIFILAFAVCVLGGATLAAAWTPDTTWYTGNPSASSFTISTADQLAGLAKIVRGDGITALILAIDSSHLRAISILILKVGHRLGILSVRPTSEPLTARSTEGGTRYQICL